MHARAAHVHVRARVVRARQRAREKTNAFFWLFFNGFFAVYIPVLPSFPTKYDVGSECPHCPAAVPHKPHRRLISPVITLIIHANTRH